MSLAVPCCLHTTHVILQFTITTHCTRVCIRIRMYVCMYVLVLQFSKIGTCYVMYIHTTRILRRRMNGTHQCQWGGVLPSTVNAVKLWVVGFEAEGEAAGKVRLYRGGLEFWNLHYWPSVYCHMMCEGRDLEATN